MKDTILKIKKTEIEKKLEDSIIKYRKNADIQDKVYECISNEEAIKVIQDFEQIIQNKKSDIV